jgi:hypothetical protein
MICGRVEFAMHRDLALLWFGSFAMIAALSACASPRVAGGEVGGVVPLTGITQDQALALATAHCSKYGRSARIIAVRAEEGGKAVFECL